MRESPGTLRVFEHVGELVPHLAHERKRRFVLLLGLAREAGDQVGRDGAIGQVTADGGDAAEIPFAGVFAVHTFEHRRGTRLRRQVDGTADIGHRGHDLQQAVAHVLGVRRGEAHAQQGRDRRHEAHQFGKVHLAGLVRIDVLPQQRHFAVSVPEERAGLRNDRLRVAAPFAAAGVGHHTVGTEIIASAHDGHIGAHAVAVEPHGGDLGIGLLRGEQDVHPLAARLGLAHQARQVAVGIRPGHDVDAVRALDQFLLEAFGHAADDAHDEPRFGPAVAFHLGQTPPDTLLGIVADRAGVDQDDIGQADILGVDVSLPLHQGNHDFRVADIHLAAVGFDEKFASGARQGAQCIRIEFKFHVPNFRYSACISFLSGNCLNPSPNVS